MRFNSANRRTPYNVAYKNISKINVKDLVEAKNCD